MGLYALMGFGSNEAAYMDSDDEFDCAFAPGAVSDSDSDFDVAHATGALPDSSDVGERPAKVTRRGKAAILSQSKHLACAFLVKTGSCEELEIISDRFAKSIDSSPHLDGASSCIVGILFYCWNFKNPDSITDDVTATMYAL